VPLVKNSKPRTARNCDSYGSSTDRLMLALAAKARIVCSVVQIIVVVGFLQFIQEDPESQSKSEKQIYYQKIETLSVAVF
jgi:hypothetical protein